MTGRPPVDDPVLDGELPPPVAAPARPARRRGPAFLALVVVAAAVGFLLSKVLTDSTVYFRTADEAIEQRAELGARRFRVEGIVKVGTISEGSGALRFTIYGDRGAELPVVHTGGQPTGLFRESIPVVLEGRFSPDGSVFESDTVIVKHSETYRADNPDRVKDYER